MSSLLELITIKELLRDKQYREYFLKPPTLPEHYTPDKLPWKLLILKKGETKWRSKRFGTYKEAFDALKTLLPTIENAAINCPALGFMPPMQTFRVRGKIDPKTKKPKLVTKVWKPRLTSDMGDHHWCPYCRRPSIFRYATLARASSGGRIIPPGEPVLRCIICGASERVVDIRHPENAQGWDTKRPKVYLP